MIEDAGEARVRSWEVGEGWGVLEHDAFPGGCWVDARVIVTAAPVALTAGTPVWAWWQRARHEEFEFQATSVIPLQRAGYANPISDAQMLAALRNLATRDFTVTGTQTAGDGAALLRFISHPDGAFWVVRVPLPSSSALKPWLYVTPVDAADSAAMLGTFLDEEIATGAVLRAAHRESGGVRLVEIASYGLRRADESEHASLSAAYPEGWHGRHVEGGRLSGDEA